MTDVAPTLVRAQAGQEGGSAADAARGRVLIVEDEYFVALDAEEALTSAGYEVCGIATSAEEAVALAEAERPELVLMDIRLLGPRDGIEAAAEIRQRLGLRSLFATAHSDSATRARAEAAASPLGWLIKPYSREQLNGAVGAAMARLRRRG
ncbi:MAG TPA: response regulator [Crenalkalicoccus sp.]|nr:response regulator [Crenalkalicoccus sp.]